MEHKLENILDGFTNLLRADPKLLGVADLANITGDRTEIDSLAPPQREEASRLAGLLTDLRGESR